MRQDRLHIDSIKEHAIHNQIQFNLRSAFGGKFGLARFRLSEVVRWPAFKSPSTRAAANRLPDSNSISGGITGSKFMF